MRHAWIAGIAALVTLPAMAQPTCAAITTTPTAARDETRLEWSAVTQFMDNTTIQGTVTYRAYRASGTATYVVQCQTTALKASLFTQPVGVNNYTVTASVNGVEGPPSPVATKTVAAPVPKPPATLTLLEQIVAFFKRLFGHFA